MGLSNLNLIALKVFPPRSILDNTLGFFEFLKYETKQFRDKTLVSKDELLDVMTKSSKIKTSLKSKKIQSFKRI